MNDEAAEIHRYRDTWTRLLTGIVGCSAADADRWAAPLLGRHPALTLHEPATKWVAGALVTPDLLATLDGPALHALGRDVQAAVDGGDDFWTPTSAADVAAVGDRVGRVLDDYRARGVPADTVGRRLPTPLPGAVALDVGVRAVRREWPASTFVVAGGRRVGPAALVYGQIAFGRSRRVTVRQLATADLWADPLGLSVVVRPTTVGSAADLFAAIASALDLSPGQTIPARAVRREAA